MSNAQDRNIKDDRSFEDRTWDLWGELLLEKETEQLLQEVEKEKQKPLDPVQQSFLEERDQLNLAMIRRQVRKQNLIALFRQGMPRLLRAAAMFLAVITVTGTIALATSATFRVEVMKLLAISTPEYTELMLIPDEEASFDVPVEWRGKNYPSYLPERFEVTKVADGAGASVVEFANPQNTVERITFAEHTLGGNLSVDSEETISRVVPVSGVSGTMLRKGSSVIIYWTDGYCTLVLTTVGLGEDQSLKVANGIRPIHRK